MFHEPYSMVLLSSAIMVMARAITPYIFGLLLIGLLTALVQGAFQIEDGTLMMVTRLAAAVATAIGGMTVVFRSIAALAHAWIYHAPAMIDRLWS